MKISASFLSVKNNLEENIKKLDETSIDYLHLDIMDGLFVPNKTWDSAYLQKILSDHQKPLDVHLMVKDISKYVDDFIPLKPTFITFHFEAVDKIDEIITKIKRSGAKVGMAIKPQTKIDDIKRYLSLVDLVLIMSVEPGRGGQMFIDSTSSKIEQLIFYRRLYNYKYLIEVDGGINKGSLFKTNGADIIVVGSFITNSDNYQQQINLLNQ